MPLLILEDQSSTWPSACRGPIPNRPARKHAHALTHKQSHDKVSKTRKMADDQAPRFVSSFRLSRPRCVAQTRSADYARSSINSTNGRQKDCFRLQMFEGPNK